ncbi:MAG: thioredoxin family protein [Marinilabiliales bacterium]|nr:MAG: thioredoxin family protein [Marinilabiliales bacterium]
MKMKKIEKMKRLIIVFTLVFGAMISQAQTSDITANIKDLNQEDLAATNFDDIIESYKGKVVYLDFWASWCRPCKGEMPYSLNLQEEYKDKDVAFVYISTDRNATAWKNAITNLSITGEHYRVNKNVYTQMNELFNVQYIPRYVLIDKDGNVVDANAKRPSDSAIKNDIDKLL